MNTSSYAAATQWQSGLLSYATAQLVSEFSYAAPDHVIDAVSEAINQVPVAAGSDALIGKAREIVQARTRHSA